MMKLKRKPDVDSRELQHALARFGVHLSVAKGDVVKARALFVQYGGAKFQAYLPAIDRMIKAVRP